MNENENLTPVEKLTPFTKMIMSIGTLPSSFYASMSYYESMVWLYEYLKNQVIPAVNNNGEAVEELQTAFITLKTWIENYFENLDVQEEINNKLDEMAEDGTITNLIKQYIDPLYQAYETEINGIISNQNTEISNQNTEISNQNTEISNFKTSINEQIQQIDEKVTNATSGSPKGVYATVSDLTTADPDHDYIYVVSADGNWYYYDSTLNAWTSGGTYQSSGIGENSVGLIELKGEVQDIFNYITPDNSEITTENGYYISWSYGDNKAAHASYSNATIDIKAGQAIKVTAKSGTGVAIIARYINDNYIPLVRGEDVSVLDNKYYYAYEDMTLVISYYTSGGLDIKKYLFMDYLNKTSIEVNNILDKENPTYTLDEGHYITSTGSYAAVSSYAITSAIDLKAGYKVKINAQSGTGVSVIARLNSNNTYTPLVTGLNDFVNNDYSYTATQDIKIVLSFRFNYPYSIQIGIDDTNYPTFIDNKIDNKITAYSNIQNAKRKNILTMFNNITCFGDSLTYSQVYTGMNGSTNISRQAYVTYPDHLAKLCNTPVTAYAVGGYTAIQCWNAYGSEITSKTNQLTIIYLGTNGGLTDTIDTDVVGDDYTQYANTNTGCYAKLIKKSLDAGSKVILVKVYATSTQTTAITNSVIDGLATKFNVAVVKNEQLTDIIYHYWPDLQGSNNTHYNDLGYQVFTEKLIENISNMSDEMIERIYPV